MGLSDEDRIRIARAFIELQGGRIFVNSAPGEGTEVAVELPAASAEARERDSSKDAPV